jgi:hypothetical protein
MRRFNRILARALVVACAVLSLGGQGASAAVVVTSSGSPGAYHVTDRASRNGASCSYDDQGVLRSITVLGPKVFANSNNSTGEWVGWQVVIQRTRYPAGGAWVTIHRARVHELRATASHAATFSARTWTLPNPMNRRLRVQMVLYWYHFTDNGPQPIEGKVTLRLQHYDQVMHSTSYPDHPYCPGYFV